MSGRPRRAVAQKRKTVISSDEESDTEIKPKKSRKIIADDDEPVVKNKKKVKTLESKKKRSKKIDKEQTTEVLNKHFDSDITDGSIIGKSAQQTNGPKSAKKKTAHSTASIITSTTTSWTDAELLSNLQNIDNQTSSNVIRLFEDDNTIPFICRYRRDMIGNIDADQLRDIKITYQHIQNIRSRAQTIIKDLTKRDLLNNNIQNEIQSARSLDELDHLYAPFKPESKSTLSERAKALGLQDVAEEILKNSFANVRLDSYINKSVEGLETVDKILEGIKHIISHIFSKDIKVLETMREILNQPINGIKIQTAASTKSTKATEKSKSIKAERVVNATKKTEKSIDAAKFQAYYDFQLYINQIQSHQVLAINRGENLKVLTVKINISDRVQFELYKCIRTIYFKQGQANNERLDLLNAALDEAYNKKLKPLMVRQIRSSLTKKAEKISVEIFAKNLKQLLLLHPVKGKKILGIDPGFKNGCKLALISECMDLIETAVIYPHTNPSNQSVYGYQLANMMSKHKCDLIALGNGTACRETETWLTGLLDKGVLNSNTVRYCIVSENGASIYSCGDIAKKEFPNLDVNLISAASIARRLSDPLAELVKVEPKHLGVGMYQHDVNEKLLLESLNEIVMECVSFVGVDLNTASVTLLKHIAGLNATRAENILKHRMENGPFKSRDDLKKVKSIGDKTFTQCAGFIRIEPLTANVTKYNLLDSTWVHPESYHIAEKIMKNLGLAAKEIGTSRFIAKIKEFSSKGDSALSTLAKEFKVPTERIQSVLTALSRELFKDYRDDADIKPLFKQGLQKMSDLKQGTIVTGAISNITTFGCFVDIGIEHDGLIHVSQLNGKTPNIGDRIKTRVLNVDTKRKRIQLRLEEIL